MMAFKYYLMQVFSLEVVVIMEFKIFIIKELKVIEHIIRIGKTNFEVK